VLARYALLPPLAGRPAVTAASVRIQKPRALLGGAVAGVRIARDRSDARVDALDRPWGAVERLFVGRGCIVERRRLRAHQRTGAYTHAHGDAHELVITSGITCAATALPAGAALSFAAGRARSYAADNQEQALLCVRDPAAADDVDAGAALEPLPRAVIYDAPGALSRTVGPG
jgi:hypothetical protein